MGKLTNQFLNMMSLSGNEDEFEEMIEGEPEEEQFEEVEQEEPEKKRFSFFRSKKQEEVEPEPVSEPVSTHTTKVTPTPTESKRVRTARRQSNIVSIGRGDEVKVIKPQSVIESRKITDYLKENKTVVLNLEGIEITTAQRIIDCVGGASYALEGSLEPISNKIFIVAPKNVEISGDLRDEIAGDSFISPDLGSF